MNWLERDFSESHQINKETPAQDDNCPVESNKKTVRSKMIEKLRRQHRERKSFKKNVAESVIKFGMKADPRPFRVEQAKY